MAPNCAGGNRRALADVQGQYESVEGLKKEDVDKVIEWVESQPHLPKIAELHVILFLNSCFFRNEAAKKTIDEFCTTRTHCPEFFLHQQPEHAAVKHIAKHYALAPMPKLTPEGYCIYYTRIIDVSPDLYHFNDLVKYFDMMAALHLSQMGSLKGHLLVLDLEGASLSHLLRTSPLSAKKDIYYLQEAIPFRLIGMHFVNSVSFMDKIMGLVKPFMKKELIDTVQIHYGDNATLFEKIPRECLPAEVGGTSGLSIIDIHKDFYENNMKKNADFYETIMSKMTVDESRRPGKPKSAGEMFGVEGTFKKLDID